MEKENEITWLVVFSTMDLTTCAVIEIKTDTFALHIQTDMQSYNGKSWGAGFLVF